VEAPVKTNANPSQITAEKLRSHQNEMYRRREAFGEDPNDREKQSPEVVKRSNQLIQKYLDRGIDEMAGKSAIQHLRYYVEESTLRNMNNRLRDSKEQTRADIAKAANLTQLTQVCPPLEGPYTLYRGEVRENKKVLLKKGQTLTTRSFTSSTLDPKIGERFRKIKPDHPDFSEEKVSVRQIIKIPKGESLEGIFVPGLMWKYNLEATPVNPNILKEEEFLIKPGLKFKVISLTEKKDDKGNKFYEQVIEPIPSGRR
jgi:hypothetical protein